MKDILKQNQKLKKLTLQVAEVAQYLQNMVYVQAGWFRTGRTDG